ncbi:hypothetical protein [Lactococcus cremoris]
MERLEKRGQGLENFKKYNFVFYIIRKLQVQVSQPSSSHMNSYS